MTTAQLASRNYVDSSGELLAEFAQVFDAPTNKQYKLDALVTYPFDYRNGITTLDNHSWNNSKRELTLSRGTKQTFNI